MSQLLLDRQLPHEQKTKEWELARYYILSSSDAAAALDSNKFKSSLELLQEKCKPFDELERRTNSSIRWGEKYEPIAIQVYESISNEKSTSCNLVIHKNYKWLGASPDGILLQSGKLLEIKCPYYRLIRENRIPQHYWIQIQMQLECCDVEEAVLFQCKFDNVLNEPDKNIYKHYGKLPDNTYWVLEKYTLHNVKRDRSWFADNINKLDEFWKKVIYYRTYSYEKLMSDITENQLYHEIDTSVNVINVSDSADTSLEDFKLPNAALDNNLDNNLTNNLAVRMDVDSSESDSDDDEPILGKRKNTCMSPVIQPSYVEPPRDWSKWVSATSTKNYSMKDPLCDWLEMYGHNDKKRKLNLALNLALNTESSSSSSSALNTSSSSSSSSSTESNDNSFDSDIKNAAPFLHYIQGKGLEFEEAVVSYLYKKFSPHIITVADPCQVRMQEKATETITAMKNNIPIIYQGVLHNDKNKTYGIADLIVRSDWINKIFKEVVLDRQAQRKGCKFHKYRHYRIIDIKHSTLALRADGTHLLNSGSIPAYKTQLYIYNQALGVAQGFTPEEAYILGRKWNYTKRGIKESGDGWFDRPGVVNYNTVDHMYKNITISAVNWIREVREKGNEWSINPPSKPELYPNMKNSHDDPWHNTKSKIASDIGEITTIWMCGIENRNNALKKNITSWRDERLTAAAMGINGKTVGPIVDAILDINRGTTLYKPKYLNEQTRLPRYKVEFFIDFETINEAIEPINSSVPNTVTDTYLFMIGIGWRVNDGKKAHWNYECFTTTHIDFMGKEEYYNFLEFHNYLLEIVDKYDAREDFIIYHWSNAEPNIYDKLYERYYEQLHRFHDIMTWNWFDLFKVFKQTPVVVKGAFNFSLKSIAGALHELGYINTKWESDGIADGLNAMVKALECSEEAKLRDIDMDEMPIMKQIIKYNEIDCKVLLEILSFLRHNMIKRTKPKNKLIKKKSNSKREAKD